VVLTVDPETLTGYATKGFHGEHNPENAGELQSIKTPEAGVSGADLLKIAG
jgi:hypothetical protein